MWTNVFKIGGLHQISWFQFLPQEFDFTTLSDKSVKVDQKDALAHLVLSAHLELQKEGFLSTWTNSFVGPWDPSQGVHNPDEKIKLWLFLPGRHFSVVEKAQPAVSRLRVLASGLWVAPGDSEEVAGALSHALRSCIERALRGLSYVRFGDVFSKSHPFTQSEELFRRGQPVVEFIFAATEETIFVHVIISAKHVRALSSGDIEPFLSRSSRHSNEKISVIVSPHGMRGKLTGYCPGNLVKQVYLSSGKLRGSNGIVAPSNGSGPPVPLMGTNSYVEVALGCLDKTVQPNIHLSTNFSMLHGPKTAANAKDSQKGPSDKLRNCEKMFVYPAEAVLVPVMQTSSARSSLKRFWLQNWAGPSLSGSSIFMHCDEKVDSRGGSSLEPSGARSEHGYHSSSNSNCSTNCSRSSTSSDSDHKALGRADLEGDADSLMSRQSSLSSLGQMQNDGLRLGSKRSRAGTSESFSQADMVLNPSLSNYGAVEVDNSSIIKVSNDLIGFQGGWDDDDRGMAMDIQALLLEFGDFGDFFESDELPLGEPPGIADTQPLAFPPPEANELDASPSNSLMDVSDQLLMPTFDTFSNHLLAPIPIEDVPTKNQEPSKITLAPRSTEFDHVIKAEALMTFAPEYGAVQTSQSETSSVIFQSPYVPKSRKVDSASSSNNYTYSATPPPETPARPEIKLKKYYSHVENKKEKKIGGFSKSDVVETDIKPILHIVSENSSREDTSLPSSRTVLATEIECLVCQSSMCKLRHTLLSSSNSVPNQAHVDPTVDNISIKSESKKKDTIPVRLAIDLDSLSGAAAPVGVWRSVTIPKAAKTSMDVSSSSSPAPHNSFIEESMLSYGLRQPLQELLDGIGLLVQQATSFVDVALDADCGDGPYGWLALQEQGRRGFSCGPGMVHAGCGGLLASCHSLDVAGMELIDPLSVDVQASLTLSLLQSDIKAALKSAFSCVDGPLSVIDWCRGRSQSIELGAVCNGFSAESTASASECRDSSSTPTLSVGDPMSPSLSSAGGVLSFQKDGTRGDEASERHSNQDPSLSESDQQPCSRFRPTLSVVPFPSILVGYQDDWLKTASSSLQIWEKAPLEPYATPKHMSYYVVCPNIDPLTSAAADFFLQLGTVYEACKLGTHVPQSLGNEMEIDSGKVSPSGFVLLDCPQSMKIDTNNASMLGSISDYFLCLSNGWDLTSFLKTLSKTLKDLKLGSTMTGNAKEGNGGPCTVVYVVCPFPEPLAVLQTVLESSTALGSVIRSSDKERRSLMHNQVAKALTNSASSSVDESSFSNVLTLTGFSVPKLVLQIVPVDAIFRVTGPTLNEPTLLKEISFTVYNKARRISRGAEKMKSHSVATPVSGMWKDCRIVGPTIETGTWDNSNNNNSWQTARIDITFPLDEPRCLFEPLFILAEPERGVSPFSFDSSKIVSDDCASTSSGDNGPISGPDSDDFGPTLPSLHCCYWWTEDWRWMVCIWTDSRGELLDSYIYPFGGVSSRQDTKGLQSLFIQMLQQGCQILQASCGPDGGGAANKPRDFVITRIGCFFELECQEWQKALYSAGGPDVKKWSLQLRRSLPDGIPVSSNGTSIQQQQEINNMLQDRTLPSSPNPLYSPHNKGSSAFMKGGPPSSRKQIMGGNEYNSKGGLLHWVQSISFVSVSIDHSLKLVLQAESSSTGSNQGSSIPSTYLEGYTPVKSLGSTSSSYILIPSPSMRFLPPSILQLPTCLTAESPPLAHLLHSKGSAIPLSTGYVISKSVRKDSRKEEWPSAINVSLVDYYGGNNNNNNNSTNFGQEKVGKGVGGSKQSGRSINVDSKDFEVETHAILESISAELHALSWMTVSPAYLDRRSALPFHCDMVLRIRRLLHFADKELSREKARG